MQYETSPIVLQQHLILLNLRANGNTDKCKPDKEYGMVILEWKLYDKTVSEILNDKTKFQKLTADRTTKREASLQRLL